MKDLERERRWNALLVAALEVEPHERRELLEEHEPDDHGLVAEILEALRAEADGPDDFLERPAVLFTELGGGEHAADGESDDPVRIGGYRILERLGSGGMGEVFRAEQETPVRRQVALKRIATHLPPAARARFLAEQQALARTNHGCVARFLDAGTTAQGRPWFTMELIEGEAITSFCDRRKLPPRSRIELFLGVCAGVEHAHRRQILHRDLKPSNVLVVEEDDRPVPKIIDFGIAKLLDASGELRTSATRHGVLGTPSYLSPEALAGDPGLDTRTDVYSLGVLLVELLVGRRPFEIGDPGLGELLRRVREDDPTAPSALLEALDPEEAAAVARDRSRTTATLQRELRSELRWIVERTLEKDPERRYGSVRELADDLRRFLANEPVLARAPTAGYRVRKFVLRHRAGVVAAVLATLGLVVGAAGLGVGLLRARAEASSARAALVEAETVSDFLVELFREADPTSTDGERLTVEQLLDRGAATISDRFGEQPGVRARLLQTLGEVLVEQGELDRAEPLLKEAQLLLEETLPSSDAARSAIHRSLGVLATHRRDWASAEREFSRALAEMPPDTDPEVRALARHNLGVVVYRQGRYDEAEEHLVEALEIRQRELDPDHPHLARSFNALGAILLGRNRPEDALGYVRSSVEHRERTLGPDHPDLAKALGNLAKIEAELGLFDEALSHSRRAVAIEVAALGPDHPDLARTYDVLARAFFDLDRVAESCEASEHVVRIQQSIGNADRRLARKLGSLGYCLVEAGRFDAAEKTYREMAAILERETPAGDPERTRPRLGLAFAAWKRGDLGRAETEARAVHEIRSTPEGRSVGSPAATLRILAGVARDRGDLDEAEGLYREALDVFAAVGRKGRSFNERRLREEYAELLRATGRASEASALVE